MADERCVKRYLILYAGTEVFFRDARTRRDHLLCMVDDVMEDSQLPSLALTFESLCKFFSNKDASGLLGLPNTFTKVCCRKYQIYSKASLSIADPWSLRLHH